MVWTKMYLQFVFLHWNKYVHRNQNVLCKIFANDYSVIRIPALKIVRSMYQTVYHHFLILHLCIFLFIFFAFHFLIFDSSM